MTDRYKGAVIELDPNLSPEERDRVVATIRHLKNVNAVVEGDADQADVLLNRLRVRERLTNHGYKALAVLRGES